MTIYVQTTAFDIRQDINKAKKTGNDLTIQ